MPDLPPVSELLPHRGAVVLLERVVEHDRESTTARVEVGPNGWLSRQDGSTPAWLAIEYMAQCASAHEGLLARAEGRALPEGVLVRVFGLRIHRSRFEPGEALCVSARRARGRPEIGAISYACSIRSGEMCPEGAALAEGRLSVALTAGRAV